MKPYISFVIPVYNEEENIPILFRELTAVAEKLDPIYEIFKTVSWMINRHVRIDGETS